MPNRSARPFSRPLNMNCAVFLGDSMTGRPNVANSYPTLIGAARGIRTVINLYQDGDDLDDMMLRLDLAFNHRPGIFSLMAGTNDSFHGRSLVTYEGEVRTMADRVLKRGAKFTLCTPPICLADARPLEDYNDVLRDVADDISEIVLIDFYALSATWDAPTQAAYYEASPDLTHLKLAGNQALRDYANEAGNLAAFRV
jgi:hypothetical protein